MRLMNYVRRPDVSGAPLRYLRRRIYFEILRRMSPQALSRDRTVNVLGRFRMSLRLDDVVEQAIYNYGVHEFKTLKCFAALMTDGIIVLDVGAHSGQFSLWAASAIGAGGRVIAFEPNPSVRARLKRNIAINGVSNIAVRSEALAHFSGSAALHRPDWAAKNAGAATLIPQPEGTRIADVIVARLDDIVGEESLTRCDVMKIDVEGMEAEVLLGGERTLDAFHPTIVFEANDFNGEGTEWGSRTAEILYRHGYRLHGLVFRDGRVDLQRVEPGGDLSVFRETREALNLVAVPASRMEGS